MYASKNASVEGSCLSLLMPYELKTLLKLHCEYKLQNLPQIRRRKQNFPLARSCGAATFSRFWFRPRHLVQRAIKYATKGKQTAMETAIV